MLSRRDLFKLVGLASAAGAAGALTVVDGEPVSRAYSFVGGWARDWRFAEYDVRHWGVVGDGLTDDTAALQRAIDNCRGGLISAHGLGLRISRTIELKDVAAGVFESCQLFADDGFVGDTMIDVLPECGPESWTIRHCLLDNAGNPLGSAVRQNFPRPSPPQEPFLISCRV